MVSRLPATLAVLIGLPLPLFAQDPILMLHSAPSREIRGAHCNESGHVFAITHVNGEEQVCFQTTSSAPNPVFRQGSLNTGPFESQLPLMTVHGTDLVIIQGQGTGTGKTATVVDGNGAIHYRLFPGNYPSGLDAPTLAVSWGVGLPLPSEGTEKGGAKFALGCNFVGPNGNGSSLGLVFRLVGPSSNFPPPFLFAPSNPDAADSYQNLGLRHWTYIPVPKTDGNQAVLYRTHPNGFANPLPDGFYCRPVMWEFTPEGELNGNYGQPIRIIDLPTPISGPGLPPEAQAIDVFEAAPWTGSAFLGAILTSEGSTCSAIYDAPEAMAAVQDTTDSDIDCQKADLNGDGVVDGKDMDLLLEYSLQSPQDLRGDLTGSGRVDSGDFEYMHRAIEKCSQGGKVASMNRPVNVVLGSGQTLPGLPDHRMNFITGVRGNGLGTGVFMVSATNETTSHMVDAVILMDGAGVRTIVRTGDDFGQGSITAIGDTTARRGLSQVNRHGQFALTVSLADGSQAVYRIDGTNTQAPPPVVITAEDVARGLLKQTGASSALDVNEDGIVDAADVVAAQN